MNKNNIDKDFLYDLIGEFEDELIEKAADYKKSSKILPFPFYKYVNAVAAFLICIISTIVFVQLKPVNEIDETLIIPTTQPKITATPDITEKPVNTPFATELPDAIKDFDNKYDSDIMTSPISSSNATEKPSVTMKPGRLPISTKKPVQTKVPDISVEVTKKPLSTADPKIEPADTAKPTKVPVVTPEPTEVSAMTPNPTDEPVITLIPTESSVPTATPNTTDEPVITPIPTEPPVITPNPTYESGTPMPTPEPIKTPSPTGTYAPTETPPLGTSVPTAPPPIETGGPTPTPTPEPTASPPIETGGPTPTPEPTVPPLDIEECIAVEGNSVVIKELNGTVYDADNEINKFTKESAEKKPGVEIENPIACNANMISNYGFSISFWANTSREEEMGPTVTFINDSQCIVVRINGNVDYVDIDDRRNYFAADSDYYSNPGEWHYYTITYANDWITYYVDGIEVPYSDVQLVTQYIKSINDVFLTKYNPAVTWSEEDYQNDWRGYLSQQRENYEYDNVITRMNYAVMNVTRYRDRNNSKKILLNFMASPDTRVVLGGGRLCFNHSLAEYSDNDGTRFTQVRYYNIELTNKNVYANYHEALKSKPD